MSTYPASVDMIRLVAQAFGELNERTIYVGGATVPFYLPEQYWPQARPTEDVDVVIEVVGKLQNWVHEEELRKKGFQHDTSEGAPICRWVYKGLKVDVMNSDESVFGFTNRWYQEGIDHSVSILLKPQTIRIFSLPYFIATKMEAFKGRGQNDYRASSDMEDIVSVLEVAPEVVWEEGLANVSRKLRTYLKNEFTQLKANSGFLDALPGAVFNRLNTQSAVDSVRNRIDKLILRL